ncbi:MAG: DoxX family protein [Chloracidobacterium sp.]|nr:DoxX family protein [Chloracidobacterium sp.]
MSIVQKTASTAAPPATILIRFIVGLVFFSEGIQKFLYPAEVGAGRFAKIPIPNPEMTASLVGSAEIVCGLLVIFGILTRLAVLPLIVIMLTALFTTKIPILLGSEFLGFSLRKVSYYGIWGFLHESRTDLAMLFGSLFLLITGAGPLSFDAKLARRK